MQPLCAMKNTMIFLKALFKNPRFTGAILPSSSYLANEMASHVYFHQDSFIVELGAGTGVITKALLGLGIQPSNIILIEYSPLLVRRLRAQFPNIRIIQGNAETILTHLAAEQLQISTIISSLPLRSLPKTLTKNMLTHIEHILPSGGKYIQFTYSFFKNTLYNFGHQQPICSKRIWLNLPPALVTVWKKA